MKRRLGKRRRGGAAVEMAVVTPLLLTLLFGIIEYGWAFAVKQSLVTAAREGARVASMPGSTDGEITARVADYMQPLGLDGFQIELERATTDNPVEKVRVWIAYSDFSLVGGFFGTIGYNLESTCSMRKEGVD